ncbi:MAG: hypothetical protein ABIS18_08135 [Actinomycetota bacterium]
MRRTAIAAVLVAVLATMGNASASSTVSKDYDQNGDPVLVCQLNDLRASSKGACLQVPPGENYVNISVYDQQSWTVLFSVEFLNAAGLPLDPVGSASGLVGGLLGFGGGICGYTHTPVPEGAAYLRVALLESPPFFCGTGTSGTVEAYFHTVGPF